MKPCPPRFQSGWRMLIDDHGSARLSVRVLRAGFWRCASTGAISVAGPAASARIPGKQAALVQNGHSLGEVTRCDMTVPARHYGRAVASQPLHQEQGDATAYQA